MTSSPSVLISCGHLIRNIQQFRGFFEEAGVKITVPNLVGQQFNGDEMTELLKGHDTAILGDDTVTEQAIKAAFPKLRALIKWGIGTDNIDLIATKLSGIPVYNTPGQFSGEVADLAIGMMLTLARQINIIDQRVRNGEWYRVEGESIGGSRAHIIGMGNIAQSIKKRLVAFDVDVTGSDPFALPSNNDFPCVELKYGLADADWVFVACALTDNNSHLINDDVIKCMKRGARLINVARGALVDEVSLINHLASGHLLGAGLDVFENEPFSPLNPLTKFPNVLLGSHGGSSTRQAINRVNMLTVRMALKVLSEGQLDDQHNQVNS
jgi:D-3-phosphoglycerate dehydrogenase / 2-oxoglutarate reductase